MQEKFLLQRLLKFKKHLFYEFNIHPYNVLCNFYFVSGDDQSKISDNLIKQLSYFNVFRCYISLLSDKHCYISRSINSGEISDEHQRFSTHGDSDLGAQVPQLAAQSLRHHSQGVLGSRVHVAPREIHQLLACDTATDIKTAY